MDNRQRSTDRGLVKVVAIAPFRAQCQCLVIGLIATECFFVRRNDVDAALQPSCVAVGNILIRRAIDDDRVWQVIRMHMTLESIEVHAAIARIDVVAPSTEVDPAIA